MIPRLAVVAVIIAAASPAFAGEPDLVETSEAPGEMALAAGPEWSLDENEQCVENPGFPSVGPGNPFFWNGPNHGVAMQECFKDPPPQSVGNIVSIIQN